ncbi:MAG: extracellular solute-binding protein [Lachnospiraceae bacterium]|nr:extracellular solute-binding protein [Lachnospiraceae bacterium]
MKSETGMKKTGALAMIFAAAVLAAGCGKSQGAAGSKSKAAQIEDLKNTTYEVNELEAGIKTENYIQYFEKAGDKIYFDVNEYKDLTQYPADWVDGNPPEDAPADVWDSIEYKYEETDTFYELSADGKEATKLYSLKSNESEKARLVSAVFNKDGESANLYSFYSEEGDNSGYDLTFRDAQGKDKKTISLNDFMTSSFSYIDQIFTDKNNRVYLCGANDIIIIDEEGKEQGRVKFDGWINTYGYDKEGNIAFVISNENSQKLTYINPETLKMEEGTECYGGVDRILPGEGEFDVYVSNTNGIAAFDYKGNHKDILNWVGSNVDYSYIGDIQPISDGTFYATKNPEGGEGEYTIVSLTKVAPEKVASKKAITYGGLYISDSIKSEAIRFNKSQDEYQIVLHEYSAEEDPAAKMNADFLAGDVPDILDLSSAAYDKYAAKGMLTDLYTFMEKDPEVKKDDFYENFLKIMETDGKLYYISPLVQINCFAGRKSDLEGKKNLTVQDIMDLEKKYDGDRFFASCGRESVLGTLANSGYADFVDWNTGKCSFDSDEFIKILEYANTYPDDESVEYIETDEMIKNLKAGRLVMQECWNISFEDVEMLDTVYDGDFSAIGYPPAEGDGIVGSISDVLAIYSKSENPEGAWAFLKRMFTKEYYAKQLGEGGYMSGYPIRKDAFEYQVERAKATKEGKDEFGYEVYPMSGTWEMGDIQVDIKPVTDEQVQVIRDLMASVDHKMGYDDDIFNIITEEAGALFSGQKSAKEVAGIIQNRVSTYVNENR